MITKHPVAPVLSRGEREAYLPMKYPPVSSWLPDSLLPVRVPGAPGAGTLGADVPNVAAEVASVGEHDVGGVAACGV